MEPKVDMSTSTYSVEGMSCAHCELSVREEVEQVTGVREAHADHRTGRLTVEGDAVDIDAVREAVAEAGYRLVDQTDAR